jgi:hypothetical protein
MKHQEHNLQKSCIEFFNLQYPKGLMTAIPNASKRSVIEGRRMKAEGLTTGFPDTMVIYKGKVLFIEFKTGKNKLTEHQHKVRETIINNGFSYYTCYSVDEFMNILKFEL